jgi:hypothetical protein
MCFCYFAVNTHCGNELVVVTGVADAAFFAGVFFTTAAPSFAPFAPFAPILPRRMSY